MGANTTDWYVSIKVACLCITFAYSTSPSLCSKTHSDSRAASMSSGSVSVSASEGEPCYKTADLPRGAMAKHVAHIPDDLHSASPMTQFVSTPSPSRGYSRSLGTLGDMNVVSFKK